MADVVGLLEHRIPDFVSTEDLPLPLAAEIDFFAGRVEPWLQHSGTGASWSARGHALLGNDDAARAALDTIDIVDLDVSELVAAAWAASRVGGTSLGPLLSRVEAEPDGFWSSDVPLGPKSLWMGVLHAAVGNVVGAAEYLDAAVEQGDRRAPIWGALARLELGRVLRTAEAVPLADLPPSSPTLLAARTFFAAGGYRSLLARVVAIDEPVGGVLDLAATPRLGFGVQPAVEVRASKGLSAIEHLIEHRDRVVTAAELGVVLDGGDPHDITALTAEVWRDASVDEDNVDMADEVRRIFFNERTRSRVTKLLRRTIDKISESHELFGAHLSASVSTGHRCGYQPRGGPVRWTTGHR